MRPGAPDRPAGHAPGRDAAALASLFAFLLLVLPQRLVLPALGAAGTPATVVAIGLAVWWVAARVIPSFGVAPGPQPVRTAFVVYAWWMLLTYALGHLSPMTDISLREADRALITLVAMGGVTLLAADGIRDRARLDTVAHRIVVLGSFVALVGIVQFATGFNPLGLVKIPGLTENGAITTAVALRDEFNRPNSTTAHPIEFAVTLAMILPLALAEVMTASAAARRRLTTWLPVVLIAVAIPMTVSRSAILGLVVGVGVLAMRWSWRRRLNVAVVGVLGLGMMRMAVPGLLGTIRNLVLNAGNDSSILARVDDVAAVSRLVSEDPLFGIGYGIFTRVEYILLDNQYYATAVESGILGVLLLMVLLATAGAAARRGRQLATDAYGRELGQALMASICVAAVSLATFDGWSFRTFTGLLFLLVGCAGSLWRLEAARAGGVAGTAPVRGALVAAAGTP